MIEVGFYYGLIDDIQYEAIHSACDGLDINRIPLLGNASVNACNRQLNDFNTAMDVIDPYYVYGECPIVQQIKFPEFYQSPKFLQEDTGLQSSPNQKVRTGKHANYAPWARKRLGAPSNAAYCDKGPDPF